jgi:hypothetical protein
MSELRHMPQQDRQLRMLLSALVQRHALRERLLRLDHGHVRLPRQLHGHFLRNRRQPVQLHVQPVQRWHGHDLRRHLSARAEWLSSLLMPLPTRIHWYFIKKHFEYIFLTNQPIDIN